MIVYEIVCYGRAINALVRTSELIQVERTMTGRGRSSRNRKKAILKKNVVKKHMSIKEITEYMTSNRIKW